MLISLPMCNRLKPKMLDCPVNAYDYNYRAGRHELRIFLAEATPAEVGSVESGPVEFGLCVVDPTLLVLISRFHSADKPDHVVCSFDCFYCWHRVSADERTSPPEFTEMNPWRAPVAHHDRSGRSE